MSLNSESSVYENVEYDVDKDRKQSQKLFLVENCTWFCGSYEQHQFFNGKRIGWKTGEICSQIFSCAGRKNKCRYHHAKEKNLLHKTENCSQGKSLQNDYVVGKLHNN